MTDKEFEKLAKDTPDELGNMLVSKLSSTEVKDIAFISFGAEALGRLCTDEHAEKYLLPLLDSKVSLEKARECAHDALNE
jgi:hypothetical protein